MSEPEKKYGWFSETAYMSHNHIITYTTMNGDKVNVSSVTNTPYDSKTSFKDIKFIGELDSFVSSVPNKNKISLFKKYK